MPLTLRTFLLAALAATALSACATVESYPWTFEVEASPRTCVYALRYEWAGVPMLNVSDRARPKACGSLSGSLGQDGSVPKGVFTASWTDETGRRHQSRLSISEKLRGRDLVSSRIRVELADTGLRLFIAEPDRTKPFFGGGAFVTKPEVLVYAE